MPQLHHHGWIGQPARTWNPSLPPPRGSLAEEGSQPEQGFKFGHGASGVAGPTASFRNVDIASESRRSSSGSRKQLDSFAETEAEEAEKQRRAFLAATYGSDGKRARERLSFAGPNSTPQVASPGASSAILRRQSLMLWERINTVASATRLAEETGSPGVTGVPSAVTIAKSLEDIGPRRGSLPLAIPGSHLGRVPSHRRDRIDPILKKSDEEDSDSDPEDEEDSFVAEREEVCDMTRFPACTYTSQEILSIPQRPLPPLLPLSDPGPRLLPSTLALHRANHLLNSRNLQADPLPHPLPPSLHPPAPVDLAEFDIDFILSGSQAQLGGEGKPSNDPVDVRGSFGMGSGVTPTFKLGRDDEDTFAKFVGEFDDEYGGRRGEWTFRACPGGYYSQSPTAPENIDIPRAEWDCAGAGKYELFSSGDVRSVRTGSRWRIRKAGSREYELQEQQKGRPIDQSTSTHDASESIGDTYVLTSKLAHGDHGGAKLASVYRANVSFPPVAGPNLRVSISDQRTKERSSRMGSADSAATARPAPNLSSSYPLASAVIAKKNRSFSRGDQESDRSQVPLTSLPERGRASMSAISNRNLSADPRKKEKQADNKDKAGDDEKRKGGGLGGALKRAFKSTIAANEEKKAAREEREREKMQSQSWSPSVSRSKDFVHPSGKGIMDKMARGQTRTMPAAVGGRYTPSRETSLSSRAGSDISDRSRPPPSAWSQQPQQPSDASIARPKMPGRMGSDDHPAHSSSYREGKAWEGVPHEAIAMVIPIEDETIDGVSHSRIASPTKLYDGSRQALLVWYVPFNSDAEERTKIATSVASSRDSSDPSTIGSQPVGIAPTIQSSSSGSIPKFQKLLRRRASKDKDTLKRDREGSDKPGGSTLGSTSTMDIPAEQYSGVSHPLPFRSFRVVACVVDVEDLRSENGSANSSYGPFSPARSLLSPARAPSSLGSGQSPSQVNPSLPSTDEHESSSSLSTAPTSNIFQGRTFPTVIAVCHSRSQGVEFVMEGLDRLGFCQGDSAWGPTGYEEWRGSGLSEQGRELLNLLWAGCTGVMGLTGV